MPRDWFGCVFVIFLKVRLTLTLNEISGGCEKNCTSFRIILQYFKVVKDDSFYWVIVRVKCEGEWNSVILFLL